MTKIRPLKTEDIKQIVESIKEHQVENGHKWISLNSEGYYWMLANLFKDYCFVAEQDDSIVGFITGIPHGDNVYLEDVLVKKIKRRKKIGTNLMRALEKNSFEKHREIWATVNPENKASLSFFDNNQYTNIGLKKNLKGKEEHRFVFRKTV